MERQWSRFIADEEWIDIKRKMSNETGEPVLRVTGRVLRSIEYFPIFNPALND
jgi:hypothetical protein